MNTEIQTRFMDLWQRYSHQAELPVGFYFTDEAMPDATVQTRCVMAAMHKVRKGETVAFSRDSIQCFGAKAYIGYDLTGHAPSEDGADYTFTEQFLSTGVPGIVEGERIKQNPEVCRQMYRQVQQLVAPADWLVFKRWDQFLPEEEPEVVIFFAKPDVISGLYNLVNYDSADQNAVIAPWGSGCSSTISDPYLQKDAEHPKAVLGMLDIAARPFAEPDVLSIAMPTKRLLQIMDQMEDSFLSTEGWRTIQKRI